MILSEIVLKIYFVWVEYAMCDTYKSLRANELEIIKTVGFVH